MQYGLIFTDTGNKEISIIRGTSGTFGTLNLTVVDEAENAVNFTGMTTVKKIYVGVEGGLKIDGATVTSETAASGLITYTIPWATFSADTDCGTFYIEIYLADNASPTKAITAGKAILRLLPSIID